MAFFLMIAVLFPSPFGTVERGAASCGEWSSEGTREDAAVGEREQEGDGMEDGNGAKQKRA